MSKFKFFDNDSDIEVPKSSSAQQNATKAFEANNFKEGKAKYRSEQVVIIKVDGVIENHADTKLEYDVVKKVDSSTLVTEVKLVDQIVRIQPAYLQEDFDLLSKVDFIKSNVSVSVNPLTGRIDKIKNIAEIKENWTNFKNEVIRNTSFVQSDEMKKSISTYLSNTEIQFEHDNLLQDFQIRPFFDLFFDKYLVSKSILVNNHTRLYYSQLFDRLPIELNIDTTILNESPENITILKSGNLNRKNLDLQAFEKIYDFRYKPRIGYKFDGYDFTHHTQVCYDLNDDMLLDAQMTINEVVRNNIEVYVEYKIRRVE